MKVSYLVAIGIIVLFGLFFVLDYVHTSAPVGPRHDSTQTPVSAQPDSMDSMHTGDIIKQQSTRDIFDALAGDDTTNPDMKPD